MKSYFRRFRHIRGWLFLETDAFTFIETDTLNRRIGKNPVIYFELRIFYWVELKETSDHDPRYRSLPITFLHDMFNGKVYLTKTCNSQSDYVETLVPHTNVPGNIPVYQCTPHHPFPLLPQYM